MQRDAVSAAAADDADGRVKRSKPLGVVVPSIDATPGLWDVPPQPAASNARPATVAGKARLAGRHIDRG
jgi:hypothetical protein